MADADTTVVRALREELDFLGTVRGTPVARNGAVATVYRLAGRLAAEAEAKGAPEAPALRMLANEPWEAIDELRRVR